jgi:hypothetical protein
MVPIGGWMGPRASLDIVADRKITAVAADNQTLINQSRINKCTNIILN